MITSYISDTFLRELKEAFPNRLPKYGDYFGEARIVTPEQIAFLAGIQHCINYLEAVAETQRQSGDREGVSIEL